MRNFSERRDCKVIASHLTSSQETLINGWHADLMARNPCLSIKTTCVLTYKSCTQSSKFLALPLQESVHI